MPVYPYYKVLDEKGNQYVDCGWLQHAQEIVKLNENVQKLTIHKVNAPLDQETVDVTATGIAELPGQQGLPKAKERLPFEPMEEELGLPQSELIEF